MEFSPFLPHPHFHPLGFHYNPPTPLPCSIFHHQPTPIPPQVLHNQPPPQVLHNQPPQTPTQVIRWSAPPPGWLKLNTDGSSIHGRGSFGGILRDGVGAWVCGYMGKMQGTSTTSMWAEIWALYRGLVFIHSLGLKNVIVETDCKGAKDLFWKGKVDESHPHKSMIEHARIIMMESHYMIVHTLREGNHCADQIAKLGGTQYDELCYLDHAPNVVIPFLLADANGVWFERPTKKHKSHNNRFSS